MVVAGVVTLLGLAVMVGSLGYLHLAPTGLSPLRNAVSEYGITRFRAGYRVATIAFGVAGLALAFGIDRANGAHESKIVVVLLVIFAAARGTISWFPMDAPSAPRTSTGRTHGRLAIAAFASVTIAAFELGRTLTLRAGSHALAAVSTTLGWAMLACLLAMGLARAHPEVRARFGAVERGFYLCAIVWFTVFAAACATGAL